MSSDRWIWDAERCVYVDDDSGAEVNGSDLVDLRNQYLDAAVVTALAVSTLLVQREIRLVAWLTALRTQLRTIHGIEYLLGRGGRHAMQDTDWSRLSREVRDQYSYLQRFAQQVQGGLLSAEQIQARTSLYVEGAVTSYELARASAHGLVLPCHPGDGGTTCLAHCRCHWEIDENQERWSATWILTSSEPCAGCLERAGRYNPLNVPKLGAALEV